MNGNKEVDLLPGRSLYFWCRTEWAVRLLPSGAEKRLSGVCDGFSRYKKAALYALLFSIFLIAYFSSTILKESL